MPNPPAAPMLIAALTAARPLPRTAAGVVPDWVHLVPRGRFGARDGRGPWQYLDAARVISESFARRARIHIDLNHSTETAAKLGFEAPAVGYVAEMEERADGIWGRIDWTGKGHDLLSDKAYWGISPVIEFTPAREVTAIARAALTNDPAVQRLTALSTEEESTMFQTTMAKAMGLPEGASEEDILAALTALLGKAGDSAMPAEAEAALTTLAAVRAELGVTGTAGAALLAALRARSAATPTEIAALQTELAAVTTSLNEMRSTGAREKAEAYVDAEVRRGRIGLKPVRDRYVALHTTDPATAIALIEAMPMLGAVRTAPAAAAATDGTAALQTEDLKIATMLGLTPEAFKAARTAEIAAKEADQ